MKSRSLFTYILLLLAVPFFYHTESKNDTYDSFVSNANVVPLNRAAATLDAKQIIQAIIDVIGLKTNFEVKSANVPNAAAVVYQGKRYILYNPGFIKALNKATGNEWASVSVLAHEIGHHLNGHTLDGTGSRHETELEADEFSGFVLRKMGASLYDAQIALKLAAGRRPTKTHPAQDDRLIAIARGWNSADEQLNGGNHVAKRSLVSPVQPQQNRDRETLADGPENGQPVLADKYILGNVHFNADARAKYYVTTKYNLVKVSNNQLYLVGKLAALNSSRFPYLIYDENNTQLLVDAQGNIITKSGKQVGYLRAYGPLSP